MPRIDELFQPSSKRRRSADEKADDESAQAPASKLPKRDAPDVSPAINVALRRVIKKSPGLDLLYFKQFITKSMAKEFMTWCLESLNWYKVQYKIRGMEVNTPRFTTVFGIDETKSPASFYKQPPRPIPMPLQILKAHVESATGATYNFTLLNYYHDGSHSITYHADDESFLGPNPSIASLTLGGTRDFLMKHKEDKSKKEKFVLEDGDLLVMQGTTQKEWLHAIPKRATASPRINITFRKAINVAGTNNYYKYNVGDGASYRYINGKMVPSTDAMTGKAL
ncbi:uncharacterized protein SPPG_07680 [Spizellomyces punctatus DAOM BR117]|uniref:Fe2OG dioxygenase domain-containing protein n=1 Tax=Spizellomyces punctatus (strain DAOM BR117) TaxID=645134 RepID=A0A0L0H818_SPIPD|nr:uncharacterized protein SPPG_07680 [Spizellomyces punctatus DAOM BR117]KNC96848.1 hypothetical protein SPPG_07680 [Spizellomyces punctatus DAOM BR117]|eukprot:XP_016604888.1 hypothetical protein SPPG_07680 [Spizellomyces punctatus DAOM BR117]